MGFAGLRHEVRRGGDWGPPDPSPQLGHYSGLQLSATGAGGSGLVPPAVAGGSRVHYPPATAGGTDPNPVAHKCKSL